MAATNVKEPPFTPGRESETNGRDGDHVFTPNIDTDVSGQSYHHRFAARYDLQPVDLSSTSSPSQLKRTIEAHLQETDRRLEDTQQLGTSLVRQREELAKKLDEVEQFQHEAQVPSELRRKWADIEKEHADISREVARALLAPKSKSDESQLPESGVLTSQATGSPTKISAPSRRHRNQPSTRAGDLQFAADISTSLLAQVRQLQATIAERDETIKRSEAEREAVEHDLHTYAQKLRNLDESEQKYKDENWNLETQKHELLVAAKDSGDKEKRLNAGLTAALAEKTRLQNELDELKMNHTKLAEEHVASRKAYDTEVHGLKRNVDLAETEHQSLQDKIGELVSQNQELAKAITTRSRSRQISPGEGFLSVREEFQEPLDSPDDSPPASPTKATPRHGGLESETLKSSLHHAHRMIQNLKGNIHREKTEKIELRRMLQDARDELETKRGDVSSAAKRQKSKPETFKKPARPDMLGGSRRSRTDVELTDDDWEDSHMESPTQGRPVNTFQTTRPGGMTDFSDAYQTANETEGNFDTADEHNTTESEAFMTGAESLAGDSTDELTETEETGSRSGRPAFQKANRLSARHTVQRTSHSRGDATSAEELHTPVQPSFTKFKPRSRDSYNQALGLSHDNTPDSVRSASLSQASPSTVTQSPAMGERSLFAELGGMDDFNSDTHSTPARSSTMSSAHSTPGYAYDIGEPGTISKTGPTLRHMVDSSTMTDASISPSSNSLPAALVLPQTVISSKIAQANDDTHHSSARAPADSPTRPMSSHMTPPRTTWDEEHENATPSRDAHPRNAMGYSQVLTQHNDPTQSPVQRRDALQEQILHHQTETMNKQHELDNLRASHAAALAAAAAELEILQKSHSSAIVDKDAEANALRTENMAASASLQKQLEELHSSHAANITVKENELMILRESHAVALQQLGTELESLKASHTVALNEKDTSLEDLKAQHVAAMADKDSMLNELHVNHANTHMSHVAVLGEKDAALKSLQEQNTALIAGKEASLATLRAEHEGTLAEKAQQIQDLEDKHETAIADLQAQLSRAHESHAVLVSDKDAELKALLTANATAIALKEAELVSLRSEHAAAWEKRDREMDETKQSHISEISRMDDEATSLRDVHTTALSAHSRELNDMRKDHQTERTSLQESLDGQQKRLSELQSELEYLRVTHATALAQKHAEFEGLQSAYQNHVERAKTDQSLQAEELEKKRAEADKLRDIHASELEKLRAQLSGHSEELGSAKTEMEKLQAVHALELEGLKRQVSGSNEALASKTRDLELLRTSHAEEMSKTQGQAALHLQNLNAAKAEHEALALGSTSEIDKLNSQVVAHIEQLTARDHEIQNLRTVHEQKLTEKNTELVDARRAHGDSLTSLQDAHEKEKLALAAIIAGHVRDLEAAKSALVDKDANHADELALLRARIGNHEKDVQAQRAEFDSARLLHEEELSRLSARVTELGSGMDAKSSELHDLRSAHSKELSDLAAKHNIDAEDFESRLQAHRSQLMSKQSELTDLANAHARELDQMRLQATEGDKSLASLRQHHAVELSSLHEQLAAQAAEIRVLRDALDTLQAQRAVSSLGYSAILSQKSKPPLPLSSRDESPERPRTAERIVAANGALSGMVREDDTAGPSSINQATPALQNISGNSVRNADDVFSDEPVNAAHQASQSDKAQQSKRTSIAPVIIPPRSRSPGTKAPTSPTRWSGRPSSRSRDVATIPEHGDVTLPSSPPVRPASANSYRTSSLISQNQPPLPNDHRDMIARANNKLASPARQNRQPGTMGPPSMPASAMRRPKTPSESVRTNSRAGQAGKPGISSQMSRRSSVSSFASELDERFNIRAGQQGAAPGFEAGPGTDPRMIQAITQTMIGEYLWKYTRKAGSKDMSSTRHRRYFWVHPYTRTLYWSDQDPQTAGRSELKAKSVQIESVRVVSDDNPMPPGLHRKSLEIITPGRKIKFTASTAQRHETWFNALSYLLNRGEEGESTADATDGTDITRDDLAEFSVNGYGARLVPHDRMSMSSYNSRTTSGTTRRVRASQDLGAGSASAQAQPSTSTNNDTIRQSRLSAPVVDKDRTLRASSRTRIAKMFGSMSGRTRSETPQFAESTSQVRDSSIYNASIISDRREKEEEETRRLQDQQERPGLEDVRACCDGQHHISSLSHRHPPTTSNRFSSAINRSMSRRV